MFFLREAPLQQILHQRLSFAFGVLMHEKGFAPRTAQRVLGPHLYVRFALQSGR